MALFRVFVKSHFATISIIEKDKSLWKLLKHVKQIYHKGNEISS